ncbi:hypothetical protein HK101_002171 [Irineochytrium annulatum]|nr:hypothetical protein HK101_002171 [Irineochytrium annulatum]
MDVGRLLAWAGDGALQKVYPIMAGLNVIGSRAEDGPNHVTIESDQVDEVHAIIEVSCDGTEHFVEDIGSLHGIAVGLGRWKLFPYRSYELTHGKTVYFGGVRCIYEHLHPRTDDNNELPQAPQQTEVVVEDSSGREAKGLLAGRTSQTELPCCQEEASGEGDLRGSKDGIRVGNNDGNAAMAVDPLGIPKLSSASEPQRGEVTASKRKPHFAVMKDSGINKKWRPEDEQPLTYRIMVTGMQDNEVKIVTGIVSKLKGTFVKDWDDCTHLVCRTAKFLCALSAAKKIVHYDWLRKSEKEGEVNENPHGFLYGLQVSMTLNVKPPEEELEKIVAAAGGKV